jgi:hypothetical protein
MERRNRAPLQLCALTDLYLTNCPGCRPNLVPASHKQKSHVPANTPSQLRVIGTDPDRLGSTSRGAGMVPPFPAETPPEPKYRARSSCSLCKLVSLPLPSLSLWTRHVDSFVTPAGPSRYCVRDPSFLRANLTSSVPSGILTSDLPFSSLPVALIRAKLCSIQATSTCHHSILDSKPTQYQ